MNVSNPFHIFFCLGLIACSLLNVPSNQILKCLNVFCLNLTDKTH